MSKFFLFLFLGFHFSLFSVVKAVWVPVWELSTSQKIDKVVSDCAKYGINQIIAEVRYRGDALYKANKSDSTYKNTEQMCYVVTDSLFDPLDYLIRKATDFDLEIYAWIPVYVCTPHSLKYLPKNHIFFLHPGWITYDMKNERMKYNSLEGAYLDPGIPQVQKYLLNLISDIAVNYPIDGIHLDYIRYPDITYGYNPISKKQFRKSVKYQDAESWQIWKENQITDLLNSVYDRVNKIDPDIKITAAVIANYQKAREHYSQDWKFWLEKGILDIAYPMAYTRSTKDFSTLVDTVSSWQVRDKVIFGLRAWDDSKIYQATDIVEKIEILQRNTFQGFSLYSYTGIIRNQYFKGLAKILRKKR